MKLQEIEDKIKDFEKKIRLMPPFRVEQENEFYEYVNNINDEALQLIDSLKVADKWIHGEVIKDYAYRIRNNHLDFKISLVDLKIKNNIEILNKRTDDLIKKSNDIVDKIQRKLNEIIAGYNRNEEEVEKITRENIKNTKKVKEITKKHNEITSKIKEIDGIKNNLFNFFGLIIGLLAFIFVNFQLITTATSLSLGKMIIYMGLSNVVLILGIVIILDVLSVILDKREKLGLIKLIATNKKTIFSLVSTVFLILIIGGVVHYFFDKPESYQIIKRIEMLESDNNYDTRIDDLKSNQDKILEVINKVQDENKELRQELNKKEVEMTILLNEINNLKDKKNEK